MALLYGRDVRLGLDTFYVGAVAGVDFNLVADVAEQRNAYFCAGLYCSGLEGVGGGITLDAGFGICD